jgi:hypothetical protein
MGIQGYKVVEQEGGGIKLPHIIALKKSMYTNLDTST